MRNEGVRHQKVGKASFGEIYDMEDPRDYFEVLGDLDYAAPEHGRRLFSALIEERREKEDESLEVVDVCCSYGINAALLKYEITLDDLYERYRSEEVAGLSSDELVASDVSFYAGRKRKDSPRVVGVDVAPKAVSYGVRSGLLDAGFAENLESEDPSGELKRAVSKTDLLTVTGGIGYISERTFERLLGSMESPPWVASLALRWVSYEKISAVLSEYGLVTEKLDAHTFSQRRFADTEEREYVLEELEKMEIDTEGKEANGSYHAEFYLSRPLEDIAKTPLGELMEPALEGSR